MSPAAWAEHERHLERVLREHPELETWAGHGETRLPELRRIAELGGFSGMGTLLEVGCGNGLAAAYFSSQVGRVVATDLDRVDHGAHSIGLERARRLLAAAGIPNVDVVGCSGEDLPFERESFDGVVSLHTLEHVPDRSRCLTECLRVLKPGGRAVFAVPAAAWSLFYPAAFYSELADRAWTRLRGRLRKAAPALRERGETVSISGSIAGPSEPPVVRDWASFRRAYPQFPLPKPHGEYSSYWEELSALRPSRWRALVRGHGFQSVRSVPLSIAPLHLFRSFGGEPGRKLAERLDGWDRRLTRRFPGASACAQFVCIIGEKPRGGHKPS